MHEVFAPPPFEAQREKFDVTRQSLPQATFGLKGFELFKGDRESSPGKIS